MIIKVLSYHLVITGVFCIAGFFLGGLAVTSGIALGSTLMGANLGALMWAWQSIFLKKSIALAASVIVFKYAFLGVTIFWVISSEVVEVIPFAIGLSIVIPTMGWLALRYNKVLNSELRSVEE